MQVEPEDKVQTLRNQVDGVKNIMTENVERILARGERLDDLMDKSEDLQAGVSQHNVHKCLRLIPTSFCQRFHVWLHHQRWTLLMADPADSGTDDISNGSEPRSINVN